ncbi:hypothetical protein MHYP_G00339700 [Metynnis hypsauchen]
MKGILTCEERLGVCLGSPAVCPPPHPGDSRRHGVTAVSVDQEGRQSKLKQTRLYFHTCARHIWRMRIIPQTAPSEHAHNSTSALEPSHDSL